MLASNGDHTQVLLTTAGCISNAIAGKLLPMLASNGDHKQVLLTTAGCISNAIAGKLLRMLVGHEDRLARMAFHPMGRHLVSGLSVFDICAQGCLFRGTVKSSGLQTFVHLNKPKNCRLQAFKSPSSFKPIFRIFESKIITQNVGKSFRWPSNILFFCALITYVILYAFKTIRACFGRA